MATIFLVPKSQAHGYAFVGNRPYYWDKEVYYDIPEYQDGSYPTQSSHFCENCNSNTCMTLFGESLCAEKEEAGFGPGGSN